MRKKRKIISFVLNMEKLILKSNNKSSKKRIGRGISAGQGKTSGRGTKGQKSRSGHNIPKRFEGGQTPISMRLPKLPGFKHQRKSNVLITLDQISKSYKDGDTVSIETLIKKLIIKKGQNAKILNNGKLTVRVKILDVMASSHAKEQFNAESNDIKQESKKKKIKT